MPRKLARKTKFDREREKEAVKTLYCRGESLADAARAVGVSEDVARQWSSKEKWPLLISGAKELAAKHSQTLTTPQKVAFDSALTNKHTRAMLAQIAHKKAAEVLQEVEVGGGFIIAEAKDFASLVKSSAEIAGDWSDSSASRFAVSLNLNAVVASGAIKEVPVGARVIEAE